MARFRSVWAGSPTSQYGEVLWRMDDEYQAQMLFLLQGVQAALARAKADPAADNVREAWSLTDELVESAVAYLPPKYYDAARAWMRHASVHIRKQDYIRALHAILKARYNVLTGFRAIGLMGRRRIEVEDLETQALQMLEEAIAKKREKEKAQPALPEGGEEE